MLALCSLASLRLAVAAARVCARPSLAQTFPSQNITLVVAFAAGGSPTWWRGWWGQSSERVGQTVVVENRGGAGGNIAARRSRTPRRTATRCWRRPGPRRQHDRLAEQGLRPQRLAAGRDRGVQPGCARGASQQSGKGFEGIHRQCKGNSFTYGSAGVGTGPHIGAEYFFREVAKVKAVHVPFTGGAPALAATIGNHIDAVGLALPTVAPQIAQGALRGLASRAASATRRSGRADLWRDGFPNVETGSWVGILRAGQDAGRSRDQAQYRDQRDPAGVERSSKLKGGFDRWSRMPPRRPTSSERGRELGQDGAGHRRVELSLLTARSE